MLKRKRIVIVGGTSLIAQHCARLWIAAAPSDMVLIGRDLAKLERVAADLRVRGPASSISTVQTDFRDSTRIAETVDTIATACTIDIVLIAHGSLPDQQTSQSDLTLCQETLEINGVSPVLFAEAFATHMAAAERGTLALISSVAGDRGRQSNYIYGSAKGMVTRYAQGLQHRFARTGVTILLIKPGPTNTPMTRHLKAAGMSLAPVEGVADDIVKAVARGSATIYSPKKWALIMAIVSHIPAFLFNRTSL